MNPGRITTVNKTEKSFSSKNMASMTSYALMFRYLDSIQSLDFVVQSNLVIRNGLIRNKLGLRNHFL